MNTWYNPTVSIFASILAEDIGAPELRNPLNSAVHANRHGKGTFRPLRALIGVLTMVFSK